MLIETDPSHNHTGSCQYNVQVKNMCMNSKQVFIQSNEYVENGLYLYLYLAQYLHVLQDSKSYMTLPTVQVQSNSQITDIPLTERQRLKDDQLSMSLRFFNLPSGIEPNDRGLSF